MKELIEKAIDIKGKQYVLVKDRVIYFNENYPNGCIRTDRYSEGEMELFKATVIPDVDKPERYFTGYSQSKWGEGFINKTSALENAETSAVGRALAFMGIGVIDSIASADEMEKAEQKVEQPKEQKVEKKRFNKAELDRLENNTEYLSKFTTSDDLIKDIEKLGYSVSKEMKIKIADAWSKA